MGSAQKPGGRFGQDGGVMVAAIPDSNDEPVPAEIEPGILGRQCLDRRIDNAEELTREVAAWEAERNASEVKVNWRFSTPDARIKLRKLYPSLDG